MSFSARPACRAVTLFLASALAACAPRAEDRAAIARPWVVATTVDFGGVNTLVAPQVRMTREIQDLLFLDLVTEQPDFSTHPPSFEPALAESWETSPDGLVFTFHLRRDATWSDGAPIDAHDVEFTYRAQIAPEVAWPYADSKSVIASVSAVDDHTVVARLRSPGPFRLVDINDGSILPAHVWQTIPFAEWRRSGERFRQTVVSSGPYRLGSWQPGAELELLPNPRFPLDDGEDARLPIVFRVIPDPAALVEQLLAGEIDFYDGVGALDAERVAASPGLRLLESASRQYECIAWNLRRKPFDELEVRRALTLAIDRQGLVDAIWRGRARVAAGPVPSHVWARDPDLEPWPYDPAEARRLLASRGFEDRDGDGVLDRDGRPLAIELTINAGNRLRADAAQLIQAQLARIGVRVVPRALELQALTERNLAGEFDATILGWGIDTTLDFRPYFHSAEQTDGWNFIGLADPETDRLLDAVRQAPTIEATRRPLVLLQRRLHELQPYTFLWEPPRLAAVRRTIAGAEINPLSALASVRHWRLAPAS